jgi:hypothetical protein
MAWAEAAAWSRKDGPAAETRLDNQTSEVSRVLPPRQHLVLARYVEQRQAALRTASFLILMSTPQDSRITFLDSGWSARFPASLGIENAKVAPETSFRTAHMRPF